MARIYTVNPNAELHIPPVRWTPSLQNFPIRRFDSFSSESAGTLFEPVTPPEMVEVSPKIPETTVTFAPPQARKSKKRNILKKLLSGVRNKKRSNDSCPV
jgi:hypothetical protein